MAQRTLPLLFINLGGEMLYILDQRLRAQRIPQDKAAKVMNDIVSTMFNRKFIEEIFMKHQPIYSRKVLRTMFDKLAHASIVRLNSDSMDKLYDLMTMAVKYQILMCRNPRNVIMVTLNHMDAIFGYVTCPIITKNVELAYHYIIQTYPVMDQGGMDESDLQSIRYAMLNFFQDTHVRVSVFLQEQCQHPDGRFVIEPETKLFRGVEPPGEIRFFSSGEIVETSKFHPGEKYEKEKSISDLDITAPRGTLLGTNIYAGKDDMVAVAGLVEQTGGLVGSAAGRAYMTQESSETSMEAGSLIVNSGECTWKCGDDEGAGWPPQGGNHGAGWEGVHQPSEELALDLLAKLIGTETQAKAKETFNLNLFDGQDEEYDLEEVSKLKINDNNIVTIDFKGQNRRGEEIDRVTKEMTFPLPDDEADETDDLLALMDKAV